MSVVAPEFGVSTFQGWISVGLWFLDAGFDILVAHDRHISRGFCTHSCELSWLDYAAKNFLIL